MINITSGTYDNSKPLFFEIKQNNAISSSTSNDNLEWCTYYGGGYGTDVDDYFINVATNSSNGIWIIGATNCAAFPAYANWDYYGGQLDMVMLHFENTGERKWATFIGGEADEGGPEVGEREAGIAVDDSGNSYYSFASWSDDIPVAVPDQNNDYWDFTIGFQDPVITKLDIDGHRIWCTYFGGGGPCLPVQSCSHAIALDQDNNLYVTGVDELKPPDLINPIYSTATIRTFIAKFNDSYDLLWSTYYGGSDEDRITDIAIDNNNDLVVTGWTKSANFPYTPNGNAYPQPNHGGGVRDAFIAKFDHNTNTPVWSTYFGGSGDDIATGICIDDKNRYYIVGGTTSPESTFPKLDGGYSAYYDGTYNGNSSGWFYSYNGDGFIAKFAGNGEQLHTTYYGGSEADGLYDIKIDNYGKICVIGATTSSDIYFASPNLPDVYKDHQLGGAEDGIMTLFTEYLEPKWTTYFGGINGSLDSPSAITFTNNDNLFMVGSTTSSDSFPIVEATNPAYNMPQHPGGKDGYIAKFSIPVSVVSVQNEENRNSTNSIYPNPASDKLYFQLNNNIIYYEIFNPTGQCIRSGRFDKFIDIKGLSPGIYLLKVLDGNRMQGFKFIVE